MTRPARVPPECHVRALEILLEETKAGRVLAATVDLRTGGDARLAVELVGGGQLDLPGVAQEADETWDEVHDGACPAPEGACSCHPLRRSR